MKKLIVEKEIKEIHPVSNKIVKSKVFVNVKECGLDFMLYRKLIKESQHKAGIHFRGLFEKASIGGYKSVDLERGFFDKTNQLYSIPNSVASALDTLGSCRDLLGDQGYKIAVLICGQDYSLIQAREKLNIKKRYMGERLREVLSDLANLFGYGDT